MNSLVVQTSFLGDVVLSTPLIAELATRGSVDVVTTPAGATILRNNPGIRNVVVYDRKEGDRGVVGFARTVAKIRRLGCSGAADRYAAAYLAQGSIRSALLVAATGISRRIGFNTSEGRQLYTDRVEYRSDRHHAERLWWLSMSSCADPPLREQITPRLFPSPDDHRAGTSFLLENFQDSSKPFVAIAPGSAWATKRWPYFSELAEHVARQFNVVVIGGRDDASIGQAIAAQLPEGRCASAAGRLGILASAALIGRARALVSNDSAPQHLASAMGTPTVCIYGPTVASFGFGPLAPGSTVAGIDGLRCRPCDRHGPPQCPLGHWRCMRELSAEAVSGLLATTLLGADG